MKKPRIHASDSRVASALVRHMIPAMINSSPDKAIHTFELVLILFSLVLFSKIIPQMSTVTLQLIKESNRWDLFDAQFSVKLKI